MSERERERTQAAIDRVVIRILDGWIRRGKPDYEMLAAAQDSIEDVLADALSTREWPIFFEGEPYASYSSSKNKLTPAGKEAVSSLNDYLEDMSTHLAKLRRGLPY